MDKEAKYFNAFNLIPEIGPIKFKKLLAYFGSLKEAWQAKRISLKKAGLEEKLVEEILIKRKEIDPDREIEKLFKEGISIMTIKDKSYPKILKEIYDPPALLYIRGSFQKEDEFSLAVVGTRRPSSYGAQVTLDVGSKLAQAGLTIVSGLAKGIDTLAHQAALEVGGRTIAVVGSGIDKKSIYPPANRQLAEKISCQGAVISEYPIGTEAFPYHFPARNRIISGLSLGVLIIEAPEKSGALLTANHGLEQNRQVFAIPGPIYAKNSFGPNNLIKMGAKLVSSVDDILEELNLVSLKKQIETRKIIPDSKEEGLILEILSDKALHIDKIVSKTKLDTATVNSTLTLMEMKGKVRNLGGMNYVIAR